MDKSPGHTNLVSEMLVVQQKLRQKLEEDVIKDDNEFGDFGAYYALLHNLPVAGKWIEPHGMTDINAQAYIENFSKECREVSSILDVGCGAGFITNALKKRFPDTRVIGIDLAEDAIAYAKKTFPDCQFINKVVDNDFSMDLHFDIIHVREFYPFTRTSDYNYMKEILLALLSVIEQNGKLIIISCKAPKILTKSLLGFLDRIKGDQAFQSFNIVERRAVRIKLIKLFGFNLLSKILSRLVDAMLGNPTGILILTHKRA